MEIGGNYLRHAVFEWERETERDASADCSTQGSVRGGCFFPPALPKQPRVYVIYCLPPGYRRGLLFRPYRVCRVGLLYTVLSLAIGVTHFAYVGCTWVGGENVSEAGCSISRTSVAL